MLIEAGAPDEADRIAGLERRSQPRRPSAAHEAAMAAMRARQRFDDGRPLPVPSDAEDDPRVAPLPVPPAPPYRPPRVPARGPPRAHAPSRGRSGAARPVTGAGGRGCPGSWGKPCAPGVAAAAGIGCGEMIPAGCGAWPATPPISVAPTPGVPPTLA